MKRTTEDPVAAGTDAVAEEKLEDSKTSDVISLRTLVSGYPIKYSYRSIEDIHGKNATIIVDDILHEGIYEFVVSEPNNLVYILKMKICPQEKKLITLSDLERTKVTLLDEDQDDNLIEYLAYLLKNYADVDDGVMIGFQIESEKLQIVPKELAKITNFSQVTIYKKNFTVQSVKKNLLEWIDYLLNRTGDDGYQGFYVTEPWDSYRLLSLSLIAIPKNISAGGCNLGVDLPPAPILPYIDITVPSKNNNCLLNSIRYCMERRNVDFTPTKDMFEQYERLSEDLRTELKIPTGRPIFWKSSPIHRQYLESICEAFNCSLNIYGQITLPEDKVLENCFTKGIGIICSYICKNDMADLVLNSDTLQTVDLLYWQVTNLGHYYCIGNERTRSGLYDLLHLVKCSKCYKWFDSRRKETIQRHPLTCKRCIYCRKHDGPNHYLSCNRKKVVNEFPLPRLNIPKPPKKETWKDQIYFSDFETIQEYNPEFKVQEQNVYCVATCCLDDILLYDIEPIDKSKTVLHFGVSAISDYLEYISHLKGTIYFWNGSRFDLFFIVRELEKRKIQPKEFLYDSAGNRIISMKFNNVRFMDLCMMIPSSLKQACIDFKVPKEYAKQDYDIGKIKTWDDVYENYFDIMDYNVYDVICMGIIYKTFADQIWSIFKLNINENLSISMLANNAWMKGLPKDISKHCKLPGFAEYKFLRRGLFGGRTYCGIKQYSHSFCKSDDYLNWSTYQDDYKKTLIDLFEELYGHISCLMYVDVVSLYPWASVKYPYPYGNYKWHGEGSKISNLFLSILSKDWRCMNDLSYRYLPPAILETLPNCYIECDVICPNDLLVPFLFSRGPKNELVADLHPKIRQVYDGRTLLEANRLGYRVTKIYCILRYVRSDFILKEFMQNCFNKKAEHADLKDVLYTIWKLIMNSQTGKFSQVPKCEHVSFVFSDEYFKGFQQYFDGPLSLGTNDEGKPLDIFNDIYVSYSMDTKVPSRVNSFFVKEDLKDIPPTKMSNIGVSILANSRIIMSQYIYLMKGYRMPLYAPLYTDTDSFFIYKSVYYNLPTGLSQTIFGDNLGQLKDEIPYGIIIRAVFLAPKTYYFEFIHKEDKKLYCCIKTKGVPQPKGKHLKNTYWRVHDIESAPFNPSNVNMNDITYHLCSPDGVIVSQSNYMTYMFWDRMANEDFVTLAVFGKFSKSIIHKSGTIGNVQLDLLSHRGVNSSKWWSKENGKRFLVKTMCGNEYSVPPGHFKVTDIQIAKIAENNDLTKIINID